MVVTYLPPSDDVWRMCWKLYCQQRLAVQDRQELFESNFASLPLEAPRVSSCPLPNNRGRNPAKPASRAITEVRGEEDFASIASRFEFLPLFTGDTTVSIRVSGKRGEARALQRVIAALADPGLGKGLLEDRETVEILIQFTAHRGEYLLHCHKLEHEDMGMMSKFVVV